ncbi:MAG: hypothetical protein NXI04_04825 [Planctomycetaceae bacterium]|nr:hypothetical protein [Planctomycetaceae bacterium]
MNDSGKYPTTILTALIFAAAILLQSFYIADRRVSSTVMFLLIAGWFAVDGCLKAEPSRCRVKVRVQKSSSRR